MLLPCKLLQGSSDQRILAVVEYHSELVPDSIEASQYQERTLVKNMIKRYARVSNEDTPRKRCGYRILVHLD